MTNKDIQKRVLELCGSDDPEKVLDELRRVKEEKVYRLQNEKMRFYEPNGKCEEFIKQVGCGTNFIIMFSAANGVGKTCVSANIVANIL